MLLKCVGSGGRLSTKYIGAEHLLYLTISLYFYYPDSHSNGGGRGCWCNLNNLCNPLFPVDLLICVWTRLSALNPSLVTMFLTREKFFCINFLVDETYAHKLSNLYLCPWIISSVIKNVGCKLFRCWHYPFDRDPKLRVTPEKAIPLVDL